MELLEVVVMEKEEKTAGSEEAGWGELWAR